MNGEQRVGRCTVTAFPLAASADDYAQAAGELEERLAALPSAVAVYRLGTLSAPGVSDLDRLVVVESTRRAEPVWGSLSARTRAIAMHTPFIADVATFRHHRWFSVLTPLEQISGEALPTEEPANLAELDRLLGVEGMVVLLLGLTKQLRTGRIKARPTLCALNGLRHSLDLCELGPEQAPSAWAIVAATEDVRASWRDLDPADLARRLVDLATTGADAVIEAMAKLPGPPEQGGVEPLPLTGPWKNVRLEPNGGDASPTPHSSLIGALTSRSRGLSETRWRLGRHRLPIPAGALSVLRGPESKGDRARVVGAYLDYLNRGGDGWSAIGFAGSFPR